MPHVRNTPPRRRMECPTCHRDVSYTHPWEPTSAFGGGLARDYDTRVLKAHTDPATGGPCTVNGPNGLGVFWPRARP